MFWKHILQLSVFPCHLSEKVLLLQHRPKHQFLIQKACPYQVQSIPDLD